MIWYNVGNTTHWVYSYYIKSYLQWIHSNISGWFILRILFVDENANINLDIFLFCMYVKVSHEVEAYKFLHMMAEVTKRHFIFHQKMFLLNAPSWAGWRIPWPYSWRVTSWHQHSPYQPHSQVTPFISKVSQVRVVPFVLVITISQISQIRLMTLCDIICFSFFRFYFWPNQWDGRAIDFHRQIYIENWVLGLLSSCATNTNITQRQSVKKDITLYLNIEPWSSIQQLNRRKSMGRMSWSSLPLWLTLF